MIHIFKSCHFARLTWAVSGLPSIVNVNDFSDIWEWIMAVKQVLSRDQFAFFVCSCWCLWFHHNNLVHHNKLVDLPDLIAFAADYLKRYKEAQHAFASPRPSEAVSSWIPPTGHTLKINVDASILSRRQVADIGVVVRDSNGKILAWR